MSLSLGPREVRQIRRAAYLANIGLLGLPKDVLAEEGPLNEEDLHWIRSHPLRSASLISEVPFLEPLSRDILSHHERFDGQGYPRGLKGDDIPLGGRIIHLVESWVALSLPRPYRPTPMPEEEALDVIRRESGRQFDPFVVEHFLKIAA